MLKIDWFFPGKSTALCLCVSMSALMTCCAFMFYVFTAVLVFAAGVQTRWNQALEGIVRLWEWSPDLHATIRSNWVQYCVLFWLSCVSLVFVSMCGDGTGNRLLPSLSTTEMRKGEHISGCVSSTAVVTEQQCIQWLTEQLWPRREQRLL